MRLGTRCRAIALGSVVLAALLTTLGAPVNPAQAAQTGQTAGTGVSLPAPPKSIAASDADTPTGEGRLTLTANPMFHSKERSPPTS